MTPFNTGKVQIGCGYIRPAMPIQGDAIVIQTALLARPHYDPDRVPLIVGLILIVAVLFYAVLT